MAKTQQWTITADTDGTVYRMQCKRHPFRRFLALQINEEHYTLPWGEREEIFRLGDEQAVLCVRKNGYVEIRMKNGTVCEQKADTVC